MKKITYLLIAILFSFNQISSGAIWNVTVENFAFNPSNLQVNVGDTIIWSWISGTHTTTSTTIPLGATPWNESITNGSPTFLYQVTVEGEYDYKCNIHSSMTAHITVFGTSGISNLLAGQVKIVNNLVQSDLEMQFISAKNLQVNILSMTGATVKQFSINADAGRRERFSLADLPNGIYIVRMSDGQSVRSQRIIKQ